MNPTIIQTMSLMAGIAGSEKLHDTLKQQAADILAVLLPIIRKDADELAKTYSPIHQL